MAHTPLFASLRRAFLLAREARRRRIPVLDYAGEREAVWKMNRRRFLQVSAGAVPVVATSAATGCVSFAEDRRSDELEVAVVGGGAAGLTCAYRLQQAGVAVRVFEGQNRTGGRMFSGRGLFAGGQVCELGGELIDTDHESVRNLATELGLVMDDLAADTVGLATETYHFGGASVPAATVLADFALVAPHIDALYDELTDPDGYISYSDPNGAQGIDQTSIEEFLVDAANEVSPTLRDLLRIAYDAEYGLVPDVNNLINLMFLITTTPGEFHVYGDSDEKYHLHDGNDSLTTALATSLNGRVELGHRLVRIEQTSGGAYRLTFLTEGGGTRAVNAGHVVMTIPFTTLRDVDIAIDLPAAKRLAIDRLPYGNNAKMMMGFNTRVWRTANSDGQCIAELGGLPFETWEASRGQTGTTGILVDYLSSARADKLPFGTDAERATEATAALETLWPGLAAAHDGNVARFHWPSNPWVRGSYSAYQTGDYTTIAGAEGERVGNLHFAGEHTTLDWQGYMNGSTETGELAAAEVMSDLGIAAGLASAIFTAGGFERHEFLRMAMSGRRRRSSRRWRRFTEPVRRRA